MRYWAGGDDTHSREIDDCPSLVLLTGVCHQSHRFIRVIRRFDQLDGIIDSNSGIPHDGPVAPPTLSHFLMVSGPGERHPVNRERVCDRPIKSSEVNPIDSDNAGSSPELPTSGYLVTGRALEAPSFGPHDRHEAG
jgi:hypothetical protein